MRSYYEYLFDTRQDEDALFEQLPDKLRLQIQMMNQMYSYLIHMDF